MFDSELCESFEPSSQQAALLRLQPCPSRPLSATAFARNFDFVICSADRPANTSYIYIGAQIWAMPMPVPVRVRVLMPMLCLCLLRLRLRLRLRLSPSASPPPFPPTHPATC